jgi:broad specificity phosphatase PhoE
MLFLRHGDTDNGSFNIDLLRPLSKKGKKQVERVSFPIKTHFFEDSWSVWVSPARRTLETYYALQPFHRYTVLPELYAPILLPEMNEMYKQHGENVRAYITDPRISTTMEITKKAAQIIGKEGEKILVVGHLLILNLIAYHIYNLEKVLDINTGTAKGFIVTEGKEVIEF